MTKNRMIRDRDDFAPYFRAIADKLCLKDWTIIIQEWSPDNDDALASILCTKGRKQANIRLSEDYLRADEAKQRHGAVHELLHAHHAQELHMLIERLDNAAYRDWLLLHEYGIDALADAISPFMPLPGEILGDIGQANPVDGG